MVDWDDLRFFLAIARSGNFSAAAKSLRVTQSTVGRRLASLEATMGARLIHRTADGYVPTAAGDAILEHVERVEAETLALARAVQGYDTRLEGVVRIAAPSIVVSRLLLPCFAALHQCYPKISIEVIENADRANFTAKDFDVAIRAGRFEQHDLVVRSLGKVAFGIYASEAYLAAHGEPVFESGCAGHKMVLCADNLGSMVDTGWLAEMTGHANVVLTAASTETLLGAVAGGSGIGALPRFVAEGEGCSRIVRLLPPAALPQVEIWLAVHRENRKTARARAVIDLIAKTMGGLAGLLDPSEADSVASELDAMGAIMPVAADNQNFGPPLLSA